jgi:hypothetical protein
VFPGGGGEVFIVRTVRNTQIRYVDRIHNFCMLKKSEGIEEPAFMN